MFRYKLRSAVLCTLAAVLFNYPLTAQEAVSEAANRWHEILREWDSLAREIDELQGEFVERSEDFQGSRKSLETRLRFSFKGNLRKIEYLRKTGQPWSVAAINGRYQFQLDESNNEAPNTDGVRTKPSCFVIEDYCLPAHDRGPTNTSFAYYGTAPYAAMLLGRWRLDQGWRHGAFRIRSVKELSSGELQLEGEAAAIDDSTGRPKWSFSIVIDPNRRYAITSWTERRAKYSSMGVNRYSDAVGGAFPASRKMEDRLLNGTVTGAETTEFQEPTTCKLPSSAFDLSHYGFDVPPLPGAPANNARARRWMFAWIAAFAFLLVYWSWKKLVTA